MMKYVFRSVLVSAAAMTITVRAAEQSDPAQWVKAAEAAFDEVTSYTAVLRKQQRIGDKLLPQETIFLKFRKPLSIYMKWTKAPHKGRESLYVQGWNNNRMRCHDGGVKRLIVLNLDPKGRTAMKNNLHPITTIGIGHFVKILGDEMRKAMKADELGFVLRGEEEVAGRKTQLVEIAFPEHRRKEYYARRFLVNRDVENGILIRIRVYDGEDRVVEDYTYEELDTDADLTGADFDPENREYRF